MADSSFEPRQATANGSPKNELHSFDAVKSALERHIEQWEESHHAITKGLLPRLRRSAPDALATKESVNRFNSPQSTSSRRQLKPNPVTSPFEGLSASSRNPASKHPEKVVPILVTAQRSTGQTKSSANAYITEYQDRTVKVPPFTYHVQIHSNLLTENNQKVNYNPTEIVCEDPNWDLTEYETELKRFYSQGTYCDRERVVDNAEYAKHIRPHIMRAMEELRCETADILRYILDPVPPTLEKKKMRRRLGLSKQSERWATVLSLLPESTDQKQALAMNVCLAFQELTGFDIWYLVKDAKFDDTGEPSAQQYTGENYHSIMCRVCFSHLCTAHGEFEEEHDTATSKGSCFEHKPGSINYRLHVTSQELRQASADYSELSRMLEPKKSHLHWLRTLKAYEGHDPTDTLMNSQRGQFYPCNHKGPCDEEQCHCFAAGINCEKFCGCSGLCERRFTGCNCARQGKVCWKNAKCACFRMERECDPDLCGKCGAAEALDPRRKANGDAYTKLCENISIQRNIPKRMLLGRSQVAGFGLFTGEPIKEGDFLGEYKGEVLSEVEADRRRVLHQHLREYLFVMNKDQQVDSTYAGNKIRFVNNSCQARNINCYPAPLLCNGVIRMGLFAKRDMDAGQELFFNYHYSKEQLANFKELGSTKVVAVKAAKPARSMPKTAKGRPADHRQSMIATPVAVSTGFKRSTRRVIEDSEASSSEVECDASKEAEQPHPVPSQKKVDQTSKSDRGDDIGGHIMKGRSHMHMTTEDKSPGRGKRKRLI